MKKITIKESELRKVVEESVRDFLNGASQKFNDFTRGFSIDDEEPTDYKGVFARCGYEIRKEGTSNNGITVVYAVRKTGAAGAFYGDEPEEVVEALNRVTGKSAKFCGQLEKYPYIFKFIIR